MKKSVLKEPDAAIKILPPDSIISIHRVRGKKISVYYMRQHLKKITQIFSLDHFPYTKN